MTLGRILAAALLLAAGASPARANPSLTDDFKSITQWLSHELAQGLAFNAGSTFDPPQEVKGYWMQPDLSLGIGRIPFNKSRFPHLTVPALDEKGGANIFPNQVLFPNLALHLRMGLPGRSDLYLRFADATTPSGYKISPTMTAQVQTNSYGAGVRKHFQFEDERLPKVVVGGHYNHVRGRTRLKGKFNVDVDANFRADSDLDGAIDWSINSFGLTSILYKEYGRWVPFGGIGYNYATGSVRSRLELKSKTFLIADVIGEGSERPEQSQGRWIFGLQYQKPSWSVFGNAEVKALGQLKYRSWIAQAGVALPFEIGRGPKIIYKKRRPDAASARPEPRERPAPEPRRRVEEDEAPAPAPKPRRPLTPQPEPAQPDMIFLQ